MKSRKLIMALGCLSLGSLLAGCEVNEEAHVHSLTHHDAVAETCTENGSIEYWSCEGCKKLFSDENGTKEVTNLVVQAAGHSYTGQTATYVWEGLTKCTAEVKCANCEHKETEVSSGAKIVYQKTSDASCTAKEKGTYTALFENPLFVQQVKENVEIGELAAHDYSGQTPEYVWNGVTSCTATVKCKNCTHEETETANAVYSKTSDKTCQAKEKGKYTATFTNALFTAQVKENVEVGELGDHNFDTTWASDATNHWHNCLTDGCNEKNGTAAHDFEGKEYALDAEGHVFNTCKDCGKVDFGVPTKLTMKQDYTDADGFHYSTTEDHPFGTSGSLTILNPSSIRTNCVNKTTLTVRNSKICTFWNTGLTVGKFIAPKGDVLVKYNDAFYAISMPGQIRTATNATKVISAEMNTVKAFREYNEHMMVDVCCSNLGHGNATGMNWTLGEANRNTYWFISINRDGVVTESVVPASRGGAFGTGVKTIQFYNNDGNYIRFDFDKNDLEVGDIISIKPGTMMSYASGEVDVVLEEMQFRFDGSFVAKDVHSQGQATTIEHWGEVGQVRFDGLNFLAPYDANTSYAMAFVTGVKYKPAGGSAAVATDFSGNYWNKAGTLNGIWIHSVNGGSYADGDQIIFEDGASFMIAIDQNSNFNGRFTMDHGFTLEYTGGVWTLK